MTSWKCRIASGASAEKVTTVSKVEMMFRDQAEPESGLISLAKMMKRSVEAFVEGLGHQEFPGEMPKSCLTSALKGML